MLLLDHLCGARPAGEPGFYAARRWPQDDGAALLVFGATPAW
jgi:hypothetical protein